MKMRLKRQNQIFKKSCAFNLIIISLFISFFVSQDAFYFEYQSFEKKVKTSYSVRTLVEKMPRRDIEESLRGFVAASRPGRLLGSSGHAKARDFLENKLKTKATGVLTKDDFPVGDKRGVNFIWEKKGISSPMDVMILGAHYDTLLKDPKTKQIILKGEMPGADNNASGVSILLSMIEILDKLELPKTIRIVFFDAEEFDSSGSKAFVNKYSESMSKEKIVGFINLSMLAHDSRNTDTERKLNNFKIYTRPNNEVDGVLAKFIIERGSKNYGSLSLSLANHPSEGFPVSAQNLAEAGIPSVTLSQNRETDLNPRFMTSNDFVETLNIATYTNVFKYVSSMVLSWNYDIVK